MAEKTNIEKFFDDLSSGTTWNVGVSIARKNPFPLDNTSVFKSQTDLTTYTQNGMAYMGQPVAVINNDGSVNFYVLDANKQPQEVGKATTGDNNSIVLDDGVLKLLGFESAPTGAQLTKGADGKISWIVPSTDTVDGLKTTVESLKKTVNGVVADPDNGIAAQDGLVQKVDKNTSDISALTTTVGTNLTTAKTYTDDEIKGLTVTIEKKNDVEHIVVKNKAGVEVTSANASVFVQDSFLDDVDYNAETGKVTFTWKMANGDTKSDEIDISALVDTYTAGTGLTLTGNEFKVDTTTIATVSAVETAVSDASTTLTTEINKKAATTYVDSEINTVKTKIGTDITAALTTEDGTEKYALATGLAGLTNRVTTAEGTLNTIAPQAHTHDNKTVLDGVTTDRVTGWDTAATDSHAHGNKTVLDGIDTAKVNAWDAAETNAKNYTDTHAATTAQGALADTAIQSITVLGHILDKNNKTSLTAEEAKTALGLGTAAYTDSTAYDAAGAAAAVRGDTTETVASAYALAESKITGAAVDTKISTALTPVTGALDTHTADKVIHVEKSDRDRWDAAVAKLEDLTGEDLSGSGSSTGGIAAMINTAIEEHKKEADATYATKTQVAADIKTAKDALAASIAETDADVAQNTADVATLKEKDTAFESRIAALEGSKDDYKSADETLQSTLEGKITAATNTLTTAIGTAKTEAITEAKAYADDVKNTILGDNEKLKDTYDTLSEISEWIETHGAAATDLSAALAAETKARTDADTGLNNRITELEKYDHSAYIAADATLKTNLEGQIATAKSELTASIATAKSEAITTAASDAASKVKTLADGAVATNTANISTNSTNIATNTAAIENLGNIKADAEDVYTKEETYTKEEVNNAIKNAEITWGSF